jgi:hypothetical protein
LQLWKHGFSSPSSSFASIDRKKIWRNIWNSQFQVETPLTNLSGRSWGPYYHIPHRSWIGSVLPNLTEQEYNCPALPRQNGQRGPALGMSAFNIFQCRLKWFGKNWALGNLQNGFCYFIWFAGSVFYLLSTV